MFYSLALYLNSEASSVLESFIQIFRVRAKLVFRIFDNFK